METLCERLRRHERDLVNGGTNASELRADLLEAVKQIEALQAALAARVVAQVLDRPHTNAAGQHYLVARDESTFP